MDAKTAEFMRQYHKIDLAWIFHTDIEQP
jgi:hypothetical protein